jgi:hypothetical protein
VIAEADHRGVGIVILAGPALMAAIRRAVAALRLPVPLGASRLRRPLGPGRPLLARCPFLSGGTFLSRGAFLAGLAFLPRGWRLVCGLVGGLAQLDLAGARALLAPLAVVSFAPPSLASSSLTASLLGSAATAARRALGGGPLGWGPPIRSAGR